MKDSPEREATHEIIEEGIETDSGAIAEFDEQTGTWIANKGTDEEEEIIV
jgi:hypothetical protein